MGYNDLARRAGTRAAPSSSPTPSRDGRIGVLASVAYSRARPVRGGLQLGPLGRRQQRRRLLLAGRRMCRSTRPRAAPIAAAIPTFPASPPAPRLPNTPGNQAEYDEASLADQRPSAPAALRPADPRAGAARRHRRAPGPSPGTARCSPSTCSTPDLQATRQEDFLEAISFSRTAAQGGKPQTSVVQAEYDANGNLLYGVFNGVDIRSESRFDELDTKFWQYQIQWDQEVTDRLRFTWLAGRSTSEFRNPFQTTTTLDAPNVNGYTIDFRDSRGQPTITYPFDVDQHGRAADHHRHAAGRHPVQHHAVGDPHPAAGRRQQLHHRPRRRRLGRRPRPAHAQGRRLLPRI